MPQQCWQGHTGCRRCFCQVPVGQDTHLHLNAHTELAEAIGNPTIGHWGVSSPMLEAQGRYISCTGTHDRSGRCSQGNAWLSPAAVPSSVGAVGAVRGSAPLEEAGWGWGWWGCSLSRSLWSSPCGELTVAEGPRWLLSSPGLSVLPSTEALSSGGVGDVREVQAERRSWACLVLLRWVPKNSPATYVAASLHSPAYRQK